MRIMVLDDDRALGRALGRILKGHEIIVEHDPMHALERVEAGDWFDLLLCDLHMRKWSGLTIIEMMKASFKAADAPVFAIMTGDEVLPTTGADIFLRKPFHTDELRALVTAVSERLEERSRTTTAKRGVPCVAAPQSAM